MNHNPPKPFHPLTKFAIVAGLLLVLGGAFYTWQTLGETTINTSLSNDSLENGLVGHWTFDGPDMINNATDRSGQGNDGYLTNFTSTTTVAGKIGQGLEFDGSDDYVDVRDPTSLKLTGSMTISTWLNRDVSGFHSLISKQGNASERAWEMYIGNTGIVQFSISSDGVDIPNRLSAGAISTGEWAHIIVVYNATLQTLDVYINGTLSNGTLSGTVPSSQFSDNGRNVNIGRRPNNTNKYNGILDDVRIYNRALSADEVKRLYDLGATTHINTTLSSGSLSSGSLSDGLVGHWTFDGPDTDMSSSTAEFTEMSGQGIAGNIADNGGSDADADLVAGSIGQAVELDGTNQIYIGQHDDEITVYTVSAWFNTSSSTAGTILHRGRSSGCFYNPRVYIASGAVGAAESGCSGSGVIGTKAINTGEWYHVALTRDGETAIFYVNGVQEVVDTSQPDPLGTGARKIIGNMRESDAAWTLQDPFYGKLDDVREYNRALSADEVKRLYDLGATTHINTTLSSGSLSDGLVGHWTFDGKYITSNNTVLDASGNGNTGTFNNFTTGTTTIGKIGQAVNFDGSNDYINAGSDASLDNISVKTVSAWIKAKEFSETSFGRITVKANSIAGWDFFFCDSRNALACGSSNRLGFSQFFSGGQGFWISAAGSLSFDTWYHVVVVYDRTSAGNDPTFYINGAVSSATEVTSPSGSALSDASTNLHIGNDDGTTDSFNGTIDDVRVYNRALSAEEVKRLYDLGR